MNKRCWDSDAPHFLDSGKAAKSEMERRPVAVPRVSREAQALLCSLLVAFLLAATPETAPAQTLVNPFLSGEGSGGARPAVPEDASLFVMAGAAEGCLFTTDAWEEAARLARHDSAVFDSALATWQRAPDAAQALVKLNSTYQAVYLALLASDREEYEQTIAEACRNASVEQDAESLRLELERAERRLGPRKASLYASGSIRGLVASEDDEATSESGSGALGLQIDFSKAGLSRAVTGLVVVASANDIVRSDFGSSILNPASGGAFESGLLDIQWGLGWPLVPSVHGYIGYARLKWAVTPAGGEEMTDEVDLLSSGLLISWAIARGRLFDTPVSLVIEAGPALRLVDANDELINPALQDDEKRTFLLLESGMAVTFGPATAGISGYWGGGGSVDGLSGFNVMAGMSVEAPFISGTLSGTR